MGQIQLLYSTAKKELAFPEPCCGADNLLLNKGQRALSLWTINSTLSGISRVEEQGRRGVCRDSTDQQLPESNMTQSWVKGHMKIT